ncbi:MAG: lamin tail domain-containing protein, partial [Verrucomicrobiota bacterium]
MLITLGWASGNARADSTTVINEIHYHPVNDAESEWIELFNTMSFDMDLGGWRLAGGIEYTFPTGTTIRAGGFLVVAADPDRVQLKSLFARALGPFEGRLSNQGERVVLRNVSGRLMSEVRYDDRSPWPVAADGSGASLAKRDPETDSASVESWGASWEFGGTPGGRNFPDSRRPQLRISELSPEGWVEIENLGSSTNLENHLLSLSGDPDGETVLSNVVLEEYGRTVLNTEQLGFEWTPGDLLSLYSPNRATVIDAVPVDEVLRGRSDSFPQRWLFPSGPTPGEPNTFSLEGNIVINEIMYRPFPLEASLAVPPVFDQENLTTAATAWQFWQGVPQSDAVWRGLDFEAAEWDSGTAPFVAGIPALPEGSEPTELRIGKSTYYFRLPFSIDALGEDQTVQMQHLIDDGAVFYLNGREISRFNLPEGEITSRTQALEPIENPQWSDPIVIPADQLEIGENVLAAEVHQSSAFDRDLAFDVRLSLGRLVEPGQPAQPFRDGPEEWVELFNRGGETIDLSNWSFAEGIRYVFPEGTQIEPESYLVIANDSESVRAKYPDLARLIGDFSGSLANGGENILLLDQHGNPADEVRYYDGGRWPALADGRGSSLELRDPHANNSVAEAWAASDESEKAEWQDIRYRMVSGQTYGLNTWNELRLGMLSAGRVLVDDVMVIEDPDGAAKNLILNSTFRSTIFNPDNHTNRWRALGNHRHSTGVPDPDSPSNFVLEINASGATDTKHNHLETTLARDTKLTDGDEYEIQMRARWVAGSNQLNVHAYYGRLARTLLLPVPRNHGTPGEVNSRHEDNVGPTYTGLSHSPLLPSENEPVMVTIAADDPDEIESMTLHFAPDGETFSTVPMDRSDGHFSATLPGQAEGTVVQFFVEGQDQAGAISHFPEKGPESRALYMVDDGRGTSLPVHEVRLIMAKDDFDFMFDRPNLISNERLGCSLLLDGKKFVYNTGVRLKGSPAGRARDGALYQGFNIAFPPEQL